MVDEGADKILSPKISRISDVLAETKGTTPSLSQLAIVRKQFGNAAGSADRAEARLGRIGVDLVDDFVEGGASNVGGTLKEARGLWSRLRKSEVIDGAIENAQVAQAGVEAGLRNEFRSLWKARGSKKILLIRDTPLGKAYVLGTFLTREVTDMGFKVASRVRGLSDEAFREAFGAEEQCRSALSRLRWPDGFVCPACGHRGHCVLAGRSLYQCTRCKKQTSSTAGTIFHATKLPLTLWFAAVHLIVTAKNGISSVELGRRLGVKQPTAWTMKHKIMAVMARREADTPLSGRVEMDDAYLGGARAGGKRGRGAPGKTPFVAAVSTSPEGRPRKVKLVPVKGFRKREIARGAKRWLAPGSEVLTDGLRCWNALDGVVGSHRAIRTGSGRQAARMAPFKWVNTTLGNIKSAITGTYRKLGPDHAQRYLASFAWRYNRRYQLNTMIPRFVHSAARTQPIPYQALIAG